MDFNQFVAVVTADTPPELSDFERLTVFAQTAGKDELWLALGRGGIHPIYQTLIVHALHQRVIEALEREQAQQRKLEEDARIEAASIAAEKIDAAKRAAAPPRRRVR